MTDGVGVADDPWTLTPTDHALVMSKRGETRLGFAILLSFFRDRGRFHDRSPKSIRKGSRR